MEWTFDGARLSFPDDADCITDEAARAAFHCICEQEGKDPALPETELLIMEVVRGVPRNTTLVGEEEFVRFRVDLSRLRISSSKVKTVAQQQVHHRALKAFKNKWGDRCPEDIVVAINSHPGSSSK